MVVKFSFVSERTDELEVNDNVAVETLGFIIIIVNL